MAAQFAPAEVFHAAASGNVRKVREWLSGGGDANADVRPQDLKDARGRPMTAQWTEPDLHGDRYPIRPEFPKIVEKGLRLLAVAAWHGQCEVMRLLLAAGAEVNYFNHVNVVHHALLLAVARGQVEAAQILIVHGADVDYDCTNPKHLDPPPECSTLGSCNFYCNSVPKSAAMGNPRILKMLLMAGMDTSARSCHTLGTEFDGADPSLIWNETPEECVRRHLDEFFENEDEPTVEMLAAYQPGVKALEMLERLRLAEWHPLCLSRPFEEFPPFKTLLWNRAFGSNGGKVGPRTTAAVARLFGHNKTGALTDLPDGVFWLIMQFFVAGEMRPHCLGHMPKVGDTESTPSTPALAAAPAPAPPAASHAPTWYLETLHKPERQKIRKDIATLLLDRKREISGLTVEWLQNLAGMSRRLEESLFRSSASFEEYRDTSTVSLIRRLQALAKAKLQERNRDADGIGS